MVDAFVNRFDVTARPFQRDIVLTSIGQRSIVPLKYVQILKLEN